MGGACKQKQLPRAPLEMFNYTYAHIYIRLCVCVFSVHIVRLCMILLHWHSRQQTSVYQEFYTPL